MTVTNLVFITRKPGLAWDDFVKYFEDVHVPLMQQRLGDTLPKEFRRLYTDSSQPAPIGPSRGIDLILEMVFQDEAAEGRFEDRIREGDNMQVLQGSWKHYCDDKGETIVRASPTFGY